MYSPAESNTCVLKYFVNHYLLLECGHRHIIGNFDGYKMIILTLLSDAVFIM
jgi:hypothetical protein